MPRSWAFYELTRNPEVQSRLHDEIMEKLPPGTATLARIFGNESCAFRKVSFRHEA